MLICSPRCTQTLTTITHFDHQLRFIRKPYDNLIFSRSVDQMQTPCWPRLLLITDWITTFNCRRCLALGQDPHPPVKCSGACKQLYRSVHKARSRTSVSQATTYTWPVAPPIEGKHVLRRDVTTGQHQPVVELPQGAWTWDSTQLQTNLRTAAGEQCGSETLHHVNKLHC